MTDDKKPEISGRVGRLIDAATEHVKTHGLSPPVKMVTRRGRVSSMGRNAPKTLPGLPGPKLMKGSYLSMSMNETKTKVKMIMTIDGQETWIIMNREQLNRFMSGCADTLRQMVEEKKP